MAKITTNLPNERMYGYDETRAGEIYITQQGQLCYAVSNTVFALIGGTSSTTYFNTGQDRIAVVPRFPLRRAPAGTTLTIVQEEEAA